MTCPEFDSEYFLYYEDFDFCRRYAQQGHLIAMTNHLAVFHQPSEITNKNLLNKYYHSTYSYLLTIKKYCHPVVYCFRLTRLLLNGLWLLVGNSQVGSGKIQGIVSYLKQNKKTDKKNSIGTSLTRLK